MTLALASRSLRQAFVAIAWALAAASLQAAPQPLEAFFQNQAFTRARLSPTGRHVAVGVTPKGGRTQLVVLETGTLKAKAIASPKDADIYQFEWVNDDRLVFNVVSMETPQGENFLGPGLYAVQRDGTDFRQLVDRFQPWVREMGEAKLLDFFTELHATTRNKDSDAVFVTHAQFNADHDFYNYQLLRLDTRTGRATPQSSPGFVNEWLVDQNDVPRVAVTAEKASAALRGLDRASGKWESLMEFDRFTGGGMEPVGFAPDGTLFVTARPGRDKRALYRFDLATRQLENEPLVTLPDNDFEGELLQDAKQLLGVRFLADAKSTVWFDARMKEVQARVDKLLPATVNLIDPPVRPEVPFVLVQAYSDVDPGRFLLFDTASGKLTEVGSVQREIDARQMAPMDLVRYPARDGLRIPAWLTVPKGGKGRKLPLVVMVHGGPWVREEWEWRADTQFLASRGYAVLEPEFRGSTGWGYSHFRKSFKQWGLAMQDDIADAARWAIAQGIADPERICIAGASYGGYATLMGLVRDPDLFKCGVAWAGVSDIGLKYDVNWSDTPAEYRAYGMPVLIGDQKQDADQLKATSPLQQAARIKQPLLLAHGSSDRRVPIVHGVRLRDAVAKTNPNIEWVEYKDEGHGWKLVPNRIDFWTRVEKFLQKNIGGSSPQ
ncbi:MAG: family peptidase [Ramlibacter sp.]|nr:family peptidase [Ramlibacter sp.]